MNRRSNQNRFTAQTTDNRHNGRKWLTWALVILVILLLIELIKPAFHHSKQQAVPTVKKDAPTFEFYKVLPKVSLDSAHLDNLKTTTQPIPTPEQTTQIPNNASYSLQFASLKDVDQAGALATKINRAKGLGSHQAEVVMTPKGKTTWYVVRIGPFKTRQAAESIQGILDRYYYSGRIFVNQK
jgi:cell division protein FtsN